VKNRIKKYIIIILIGFLTTLGYEARTYQEKDEKKVDDEEHMFI
jgi:hypothetical protein